ncbi:hypothetical protein [Rheinheimera fenheensis]|uniref:hypothetical protein n=1 Tax=Rheinheimera fenheensis TaxID=3152295 RepID=UPI00325CB780
MSCLELKNGQPSKLKYSEGDKSLDGSTIERIIGREQDFIIFLCDDGQLSWEHRDVPEWAYIGLEQYQKLGRELHTLQGRIHKKQILSFMAEALLTVFRSRKHEPEIITSYFNSAWEFIDSIKSRKLLFAGSNFYIFQDNSQVLLENPMNDQNVQKLFIDASLLSQRARDNLPEEAARNANVVIANSFVDVDCNTDIDLLIKARNLIESQIDEKARIEYITKSVFTSLIGVALLTSIHYFTDSIYQDIKDIILCSISGVMGAFVSTLERGKTIKVDSNATNETLIIQGMTRVILGIIFGALVPICASANIALGLASDNFHAIFVVSFLAGLNERFIPDLMKKNIN